MSSPQHQTEVLYEIAMDIGGSMDLEPMLGKSMRTLLDKLDCIGGVVFADRCDEQPCRLEEVFAAPSDIHDRPACAAALESLAACESPGTGRTDWSAPVAHPAGDAYSYFLDLPGFGAIVLLKASPLPHDLARALRPICDKLAESCIACETAAALAESRQSYGDIFNATNDAIFIHDADTGEVLDVNQRVLDMLGCTRQQAMADVIGRFSSGIEPYTPDNAVRRIKLAVTEGPQVFEWQIKRSDGEVIWIEVALRSTTVAGKHRVLATARDISERKQAEKELRERERFLRDTLDAIHDGISILGRDLNIVRTNQWMEKAYAHMAPLVGKKCYAAYQQRDAACPWCPCREAVATGLPQSTEVPYPNAQEPTGWIDLSAYPLKNADGEVTGVIEYVKDITERKLAEQAIAQERSLSDLIIDSLPGMFYLYDQEGRFLRWNKNLEVVAGYSAEETRQRRALDYFRGAERDRVEERVGEVFRTGYAEVEAQFVTKEGRAIPYYFTGKRIEFDGQPCLIGLGLDVSERKRAEEAVAQERNLSNHVIDSLPGVFYLLDREARHLRWNKNLESVTGYSAEEMPRIHPVEFFRGADRDLVIARLGKVFEDGYAEVEAELVTKDGRAVPYLFTGKRIEFDGQPCLIGMGLDVSERKRAEEIIAQERSLSNQIIDSLPGVFYLFNQEGRYLRWNKNFETVTGYSAEEFSRMHALQFFRGADRDLIADRIEKAFEIGYADAEAELATRDGRAIPHYFTGRCIEFDGRPCIIGMGIDITERKRAESELQRAHAEIRQVFDNSMVGIFRTDFSGHVHLANPAILRITGYESLEVVNRIGLPNLYVERSDRDRLMELARQGPVEEFETQLIRADGEAIDINVTIYPVLGEDGQVRFLEGNLIDITARKHAEQALRDSEQRLRVLFEQAADAIYVSDADGHMIQVNEQACQSTGYTEEELLRLGVLDIDAEFKPENMQGFFQTLSPSRPAIIESRHQRKDGSSFPVEITVARLETPGGPCAMAIARDITERRVAEMALRESESKLREAQQMAGLGHWFWNVETGDVEWSEEVYRIFRLDPKEFTPQIDSILALSPWPEDHQRAQELMQRAMESREQGSYEQKFLRPDGSTGHYASTFQGVYDAHGELVAMKGTVQDITERKRANEELLRLRNYLSNIIDSMPSVLVGVDPDGIVTQWNSEAQRATGTPAADAVGQPLARAFPRLAAEMDRVREAMQTREVRSDPRQARMQQDETRYEDVTVYPLLANGIEGAVIRVDDVTERVRIEEMMVQSEKMLSVGGLAAGMAHEINNPLAGMMQTAAVVKDRLTNLSLPASQRAAEEVGTSMDTIRDFMEARGIIGMLTSIRESGRRAADIVSNMLSFARKGDSIRSTHNLADLLDQSVELAGSDYDLKKKFDFRHIEIIREYEQKLPVVPCESGKIQQVFLNLLRNGAEAMHEELEAEGREKPQFTLRLMHEREAGKIRIEIEDNGPGMDEATRKRIFEPFFTTKPTDRGTGLGLSVSYFIVTENHGGQMSVQSRPGEGAKFVIRLPIERNETPSINASGPSQPS